MFDWFVLLIKTWYTLSTPHFPTIKSMYQDHVGAPIMWLIFLFEQDGGRSWFSSVQYSDSWYSIHVAIYSVPNSINGWGINKNFYFYLYRIMTYFNSLKIMSLNCDAKEEEEFWRKENK